MCGSGNIVMVIALVLVSRRDARRSRMSPNTEEVSP